MTYILYSVICGAIRPFFVHTQTCPISSGIHVWSVLTRVCLAHARGTEVAVSFQRRLDLWLIIKSLMQAFMKVFRGYHCHF